MTGAHCPQQGSPDTLQCPYCGCTKHLLIDRRVKDINCLDCDITWLPMPEQFLDWRVKEDIIKIMKKAWRKHKNEN